MSETETTRESTGVIEPAEVVEAFAQPSADPAASRVALHRPRRWPGLIEQFPAIIRASPCSSSATSDFTDARYYLDRAAPAGSGPEPGLLSAQVDSVPGARQCLTATNLAELPDGTHLLSPGDIVQVFALPTRQGAKLYVFNQAPIRSVVVKITSNASGGGKYNGQVLAGASIATPSGNLAMNEGLAPDAAGALVLNVEEDGQSGHRIAPNAYAVGALVGVASGQPIVMVRGAQGATAGPKALGDGTGGSAAADTTSWSRSTDALPLSVWAQTRTVWDSSTGTLYAYLRNFNFDARGVLVSVSGENRVTVDVATPCE